MKITVVIVSYNVKYYIEQCLHSVKQALQGIDGEIYVVDNHSHDDTVAYLTARFPDVIIIDSNHNLGFARANNIAIKQSCGEYVLLLNPDTFIASHVLAEAIAYMDAHQDVGGVGVMMHNPDGSMARESRRGMPTPLTSFLKMCGNSKRYYMSHLSWHQPADIDIISGAFCMLRRSALDHIGLLDEDFFMYGEDIDLSYRMLKGGYRNCYLPLPIVHYKGESTQKTSFRYVHVFYQAMLIFFRKHYGHLSLFFATPIRIAIYLRAFIAFLAMMMKRMRRMMGFTSITKTSPIYLFTGSKEMIDQCKKLANRKALTAYYYIIGENDISTFNYATHHERVIVVYDVSKYSYDEIIKRMEQNGYPNVVLGTYNPTTRILITPNEIIR